MGDEEHQKGALSRRWVILGVAGAAALGVGTLLIVRLGPEPPAGTPEGAYVRIARALSEGNAKGVYAYLDDDARTACVTIWHDRKEASDLVERSYPEEPPPGTKTVEPPSDRKHLLEEYKVHAAATDGADIWIDLAERRGYIGRLRRDLSAIAKVERDGDRATIETAHGTRYEFKKRSDGLWGLTLFTEDLVHDRDRAERDLEMIRRAAADYDRVRERSTKRGP